eukprot:10900111-Heterocapsa_arctica.AAC.1
MAGPRLPTPGGAPHVLLQHWGQVWQLPCSSPSPLGKALAAIQIQNQPQNEAAWKGAGIGWGALEPKCLQA